MKKSCDFNDDGNLDYCEVHECVMKTENEFRKEKGCDAAFCECPRPPIECEGAWTCTMIAEHVPVMMKYYDSDKNKFITEGDDIKV